MTTQHFIDLPSVAFDHICDFLPDGALLRLALCCHALHQKIFDLENRSNTRIWQLRLKRTPFVMRNRDQSRAQDRYRYARSWTRVLYCGKWIFSYPKQIPYVVTDQHSIFISRGNALCQLQESDKNNASSHHHTNNVVYNRYVSFAGSDLSRFAATESHLFAGTDCGQVVMWKRRKPKLKTPLLPHQTIMRAHMRDIHMVHAQATTGFSEISAFVVSASKDGTCALWQQQSSDARLQIEPVVKWQLNGDRVWSTRINLQNNYVAAGTAHNARVAPISVFDINSTQQVGVLGCDLKRGAGALDMQFHADCRSLYSCGYDTAIRLWDLRTFTCVWSWDEPFDSTLYSLDTDGEHCVLLGSSRHSVIWMLDRRFAKLAKKGLYVAKHNSPVYSVALASNRIHAAVDRGLRCVTV